MSRWIGIGRVLCSHGLDGKVKIEVEDPRQGRFYPGQILHTKDGQLLKVETYSDKGYFGYLKFAQVNLREQADQLKGQVLLLDEKDLPSLEPGTFYIKDLTGSSIEDAKGHVYGVLDRVLSNAANDIFVVACAGGREVLIPAVKAIVLSVEPENHRIIIDPIEGLFDEN